MDNKEERNIINCLLNSKIINRYNMSATRNNVEDLLGKYVSLQYKYLNITPPRITTNYEIRCESYSPTITDKVSYYVEKKFETEQEVKEFYQEIKIVLDNLTKDERIVLTQNLINMVSESITADFIGISRTGLKPIKQSCILKLALAFNIEVLK